MRILLVAAHYPPDLGALATRARDLTRAWATAGHEVHVLCGLPNHPSGVIPEAYRGRGMVHEEVDGVHVHRTWVYATPNAGVVRRSAAFVSYAASVVGSGQFQVPRPDVVVTSSPQFLAAVAGVLVGRWKRRPVVVEIRDLWPRTIWEIGALPKDSPAIRLLERGERWLYRQADHIVVVTRSFVDEIRATTPDVPAARIDVVTNGVDLTRFPVSVDPEPLRRELGLSGERPVALYAGTHGLCHGLETVVDAAKRCPEVDFVLVGDGARKADLRERGRGVPNLTFHDAVPSERMPEVYALGDIGLVHLQDLPLFRTVIPSKMFEIWACRRPVVLGVEGEAARILDEAGGGVAVPPEDPDALAAAVRELARDPARRAALGEAGRRAVEQTYDRRRLAERYAGILEDVVARARSRRGLRSALRPLRRWVDA